MQILRVFAVGVILCGAIRASGQQPAADSRTWRESLRAADADVSAAAFGNGFATAFAQQAANDVILLWEAAPLVVGRAQVAALLAAQTALRVTWQPYRVLVSRDGQLGVTFGETIRYGASNAPVSSARYITVWRRAAAGAWQIAAHAQIGLLSADSVRIPPDTRRARLPTSRSGDPFAQADIEFAAAARRSGAPEAFYRYAAPDAITFAGTGELNVGPRAIRARLAEGPAGKASWRWRPVATIAAESGDLGATIGEAEIAPPGAAPSDTFFSKYITIWQRQPNGSLRFITDGGSSRPAT